MNADGQTADQAAEGVDSQNVVILSVPDESAALKVDLQNLQLKKNELRRDLTGRRLEAGNNQGWQFSSFLYPHGNSSNSKGLRESMFADLRKGAAQSGFELTHVKQYERGSIAMLEYTIERVKGMEVRQKNVFGYMVSGNLGLDFHISKISFKPEDQKFMDSFVDGIALVENYEPDSRTQFGYGSIYYMQKDWHRAAEHLQKCLDLEWSKPTLSATEWRVLVDNLGMSYGLSDDLQKAKSIFEYGATADPKYPMFHYNLACFYGETNDMEHAMEELKVAFQNRANVIAGEGMPDPRKDDSFKRFLDNPEFQSLSKELCPKSANSEDGFVCSQ